MPDTSTHLLLPYLLAAQAQKHVTVNEALRLLDGLVQLAVLDRHLTVPPASPADGTATSSPSGATGAWAGWDLNVAYCRRRLDAAGAAPGWQAWVVDEASFLAWNGSGWVAAGLPAFFSDAVFELAPRRRPDPGGRSSTWRRSPRGHRSFALPDVSTELAGLRRADLRRRQDLRRRAPRRAGRWRRSAPRRATATTASAGRPPRRHKDGEPRHRRRGGL